MKDKREYIQSNKDWLEAKAKEEGVKALPKGIYYKVLSVCDLIEGWIIAIQQMHIGDKWELYIPAEMGYGKFSQPGIPGGSTLIFEIELLGIT